MKRRLFVRALATAAGGGLAASCGKPPEEPVAEPARTARATAAPSQPRAAVAPHKPPRLRAGQTVGLVAPAGPLRHFAEELAHAHRLANLLGVKLLEGRYIHADWGYLAGNDAARAEDFNRFASDPQVRAIFALRGGYGTMRILDEIDYAALEADPKVVLGFSDLTALLNAITLQTGLITFHGPVAGHRMLAGAVAGIRNAVMSALPLGELPVPALGRLSAGEAYGPLVGGNLSVVAALSGSEYAVPCAGNILMLEDVKEAPYRVDRMLTQLRLTGDLYKVAGIALGRFQDCVAKADDDLPSLTIDETLHDRLSDLNKPMITNISIGHMENQWTLPIGMNVSFDGYAGTLEIAEAAVG